MSTDPPDPDSSRSSLSHSALLCLAALGIVYGDIGTSPLYALRECFHGHHALPVSPANVLGILSLMFWSLILVVSVKYLGYVLRADNKGEGGILALMALVRTGGEGKSKMRLVTLMGLFGASLLYGDGMLTPAISVLSAVEGLEVATPVFTPFVIPITIAILIALFSIQYRGTASVGKLFGPVMILWFSTLALLGLRGILMRPEVLGALNPAHALAFFLENRFAGYLAMGAVFLVVTGSEALYADLGHFGKKPIQLTWFIVALPALCLNYFGQGALILSRPETAQNPFYHLAPGPLLYPLVLLSTAATVIASQAVISGVFSLTRQAIQFGYLPRMEIVQTSSKEIGQVYVPAANAALLICTCCLVAGFKTSSNLAAAYGIAVATTMVITTLLAHRVARDRWGWPAALAALVTVSALALDLAFLGANAVKIGQGGWFPLAMAGVIVLFFTTWEKGHAYMDEMVHQGALPLEAFAKEAAESASITRVPGTAVCLNSDTGGTPSALLHNVKHNKVLHEKVIILTVLTEEVPRVPEEERLKIEELGGGFYRMTVRYGFKEHPDLTVDLFYASDMGLEVDPMMATYILSRNTLVIRKPKGMTRLRLGLFRFMYRVSGRPTAFFRLPPNRVIEIGRQLELA